MRISTRELKKSCKAVVAFRVKVHDHEKKQNSDRSLFLIVWDDVIGGKFKPEI